MTHEERLAELKGHIANRIAQVRRAERQIAELESQLVELGGMVRENKDQLMDSLEGLSIHEYSQEKRLASLEARVSKLENTVWKKFISWIGKVWDDLYN